jgi:hypothetical protein
VELTWNSAVNSQFERSAIAPGLGYQIGLGAFGDFRWIGGDTASNAGTRDGFRARSGARLPFGTDVTVGYDANRAETFDLRGGRRELEQRTWPDVQLTWPAVPLPGVLKTVVTRASVTGGFQRTRRSDALGGSERFGVTRGSTEETSIPLQVALGLGTTMTAAYNGALTSGTSSDPTGDAERSLANHSVSVSGFFRVPEALKAKFPNPVQATLGFTHTGNRECRVQSLEAGRDCVPYLDFINRRLNLTLETTLSDITVGVQMNYNDRQSRIGVLNGNSQFQLGIFGQFNFAAGQMPGLPGVPR